ncbi:MAG: phage holin family protein [Acidobacteriota bacterium]
MGWRRRVRNVGETFLEVLQAEIHSLLEDFAQSGRSASVGLARIFLALCLGFWTLGVLTAGLVALFALWLPVWGAAAVVAVITSLGAAIAGASGMIRLRSIEPPHHTVRRHVDDHVTWWQGEVFQRSAALPSAPESEPETARTESSDEPQPEDRP